MNVTKANVDKVAEEIEALLPTAAFVAIDEEMTGISMDEQSFYSMGDTAAKRYAKMREVASWYNIIQFGMALFHEKECASEMPAGSTNYEAHVFNFYLFPEKRRGEHGGLGDGLQHGARHGLGYLNPRGRSVCEPSGGPEAQGQVVAQRGR